MGNYAIAEASGREAIALAPATCGPRTASPTSWRCRAGTRRASPGWNGLEPNWEGGNNLKHHLWWHRGLYHFERREFAEVLALYDRRFRNLASPLTQAQPDIYIDVQNAASMLFRLQRQGVDVGDRWDELADKAEARIGDCLSAFTLPHWMMALTAAGRWDAAGTHDRGHARVCVRAGEGHRRAAGARLRAADRRGACSPAPRAIRRAPAT